MTLRDTVLSSISKAKSRTSSLFTDLKVTLSGSPSYDPVTGSVGTVEENHTISVMVDAWGYGEVNGDTVLSDDLKLFTLDTSTPVSDNDQVEFMGGLYTVVRITPILVSNKVVARYFQVRK